MCQEHYRALVEVMRVALVREHLSVRRTRAKAMRVTSRCGPGLANGVMFVG